MHRTSRRLAALAALAIAAPLSAAPADEPAGNAPAAVIRIKPIDELIADAKAVAAALPPGIVGGPDDGGKAVGEQVEASLKEVLGDDWRQAIDATRPIGLYGSLDADLEKSSAVLLFPVKDTKKFLAILARYGIEPEEKDGIYEFTPPPPSPARAFFRFVDGYAVATLRDPEAIAKDKLLPADKVLAIGRPESVVTLALNIDRIPKEMREQATEQFVQGVKAQAIDETGKSAAQVAFEKHFRDMSTEYATLLLRDGKQLVVSADLDRKTGEAAFDVTLAGKSGSELAKQVARVPARSMSKTAGLMRPDDVGGMVVHLVVPDSIKKLYAEAMRDAAKKEEDEKKRKLAEKLFSVIGAAYDTERYDATIVLRGPDKAGNYTGVAAQSIADGLKLEAELIKMAADLPDEVKGAFTAAIKPDANGLRVHRLELAKLSSEPLPAELTKLFGKTPTLEVVFTESLLFYAIGPDSRAALKDSAMIKPAARPQLDIEVNWAKVVPLVKIFDEQAAESLAKVIGKDAKSARVAAMSLEGGERLRFRTSFDVTSAVRWVMIAGATSTRTFNKVGTEIKPGN